MSDEITRDELLALMRAWGWFAAAEATGTLGIVREVARLHQPRTGGPWEGYCTCSGREWPCPTARALEALTESKERNHEV